MDRLQLLGRMILIRRFEAALAARPDHGFQLLSSGEEAVAVGTCAALRDGDQLLCSGRSIGPALARGLDPGAVMAELLGRIAGPNRGKGGRGHLAAPKAGFFGAHAVVGGNLSIAAGVALAFQQQRQPNVAVCLFGDGACGAGVLHETLNIAALWKLPLVFICDNNQISVATPVHDALAPEHLSDLAKPFGIPGATIDGMDVVAVEKAVADFAARARASAGPAFLECLSERFSSHSTSVRETRSAEQMAAARARCPVDRLSRALIAEGQLDAHALSELEARADAEVARAIAFAEASPFPAAAEALSDVVYEAAPATVKLFFREAIARAVSEAMRADPRIIVLGQDAGPFGGSYKEFAGFHAEFGPGRVRDTPVAEAAMVGIGVGAAAMGLKPLVSITYMDFLMLGLDALVNYAAKARFKTGGQITAPVIVKTTAGAKGQGVAHSQCIEAWMMSVPGLKVVAPSNPADAYWLLKAAFREDGPVLFIDHKRLFPTAGEVPLTGSPVGFGKAVVRRTGDDVTIAAHGYMTRIALDAAEHLTQQGISADVIDLVSLAPLDIATIARSAARTGALVTVEEGQLTCGVGAEIAFQVREASGAIKCARVGALPAPVSSNPVLEAACLPDAGRLIAAVRRLLDA